MTRAKLKEKGEEIDEEDKTRLKTAWAVGEFQVVLRTNQGVWILFLSFDRQAVDGTDQLHI